jgi:hypothetical protein
VLRGRMPLHRESRPTNVPSKVPIESNRPLLHSDLERVPETQQPSLQPRPLARECALQDRHRYAASAKRKQQRSDAGVERVRFHVALRECQRPENRRASERSRIGGSTYEGTVRVHTACEPRIVSVEATRAAPRPLGLNDSPP